MGARRLPRERGDVRCDDRLRLEDRVQLLGQCFLSRGEQMRVPVERDLHRRVTEPDADLLHVRARFDSEGRGRMSQVVEAQPV
jgi:hypothetical protein